MEHILTINVTEQVQSIEREIKKKIAEKFSIPKTYSQALFLAAEQAKEIETLRDIIKVKESIQKPKESPIDFVTGLSINKTLKRFKGASLRGNIERLAKMGYIRKINCWEKGDDQPKTLNKGLGATEKSMGWFNVEVKKSVSQYYSHEYGYYYIKDFKLTLTKLGVEELFKLYKTNRLAMIKKWDGEHKYLHII